MSSDASPPREASVWIWLPGRAEPVVAGRIQPEGGRYLFDYGRSYLAREDAIPIQLPELSLRLGAIAPESPLEIASALRDASPDAWGRRVIISRLTGARGKSADLVDLDDLTFLLHSGFDRIGALDFEFVDDDIVIVWVIVRNIRARLARFAPKPASRSPSPSRSLISKLVAPSLHPGPPTIFHEDPRVIALRRCTSESRLPSARSAAASVPPERTYTAPLAGGEAESVQSVSRTWRGSPKTIPGTSSAFRSLPFRTAADTIAPMKSLSRCLVIGKARCRRCRSPR